MKTAHYLMITCFIFCLTVPAGALAGKGYMGGQGNIVAEEEAPPADVDGGMPADLEGPENDKMSDSGKLFGDLYKILRQQGIDGDSKLVPRSTIGEDGELVLDDGIVGFANGIQPLVDATDIVGGEPVLTVIDSTDTNTYADYGWYAYETNDTDAEGNPVYALTHSPYPAQCVQPVADYARWGDIKDKTGLTKNRIPMFITYDATWNRSECTLGKLIAAPIIDTSTGDLTFDETVVDPYFIEPCFEFDEDGSQSEIVGADCTWEDPANGIVTYPYGVFWDELVEEVHFGRLNLSRSPEAVLQSSFDEAINTINSPDTVAIEIDAAGRLLLTKNVYDELEVYVEGDQTPTGVEISIDNDFYYLLGTPKLIGTVKKAIDSPLENVALYVKLMQDGHLVTPGDERMPIDRSMNGGIPLWKMLELEDGPADAALRPTIDIDKMIGQGFGSMVDVAEGAETEYLTYYDCLDSSGAVTACLCYDGDPVQPELAYALVACESVVDRKLSFEIGNDLDRDIDCPVSNLGEVFPGTTDFVNEYICEGPFKGITEDDGGAPDATDLNFAASFLAAAADKTGDIGVDMIVYLNSILGINKVIGTSEDGSTDYEKNPVYFNYAEISDYSRSTFNGRGDGGYVTVLQAINDEDGTWKQTPMLILNRDIDWSYVGRYIRNSTDDGFIFSDSLATQNIFGFAQQADDNLSVIEFIHKYQIPGLR